MNPTDSRVVGRVWILPFLFIVPATLLLAALAILLFLDARENIDFWRETVSSARQPDFAPSAVPIFESVLAQTVARSLEGDRDLENNRAMLRGHLADVDDLLPECASAGVPPTRLPSRLSCLSDTTLASLLCHPAPLSLGPRFYELESEAAWAPGDPEPRRWQAAFSFLRATAAPEKTPCEGSPSPRGASPSLTVLPAPLLAGHAPEAFQPSEALQRELLLSEWLLRRVISWDLSREAPTRPMVHAYYLSAIGWIRLMDRREGAWVAPSSNSRGWALLSLSDRNYFRATQERAPKPYKSPNPYFDSGERGLVETHSIAIAPNDQGIPVRGVLAVDLGIPVDGDLLAGSRLDISPRRSGVDSLARLLPKPYTYFTLEARTLDRDQIPKPFRDLHEEMARTGRRLVERVQRFPAEDPNASRVLITVPVSEDLVACYAFDGDWAARVQRWTTAFLAVLALVVLTCLVALVALARNLVRQGRHVHEARDSLDQEREHARLIDQSLAGGILETNAEGRILKANPFALELLGRAGRRPEGALAELFEEHREAAERIGSRASFAMFARIRARAGSGIPVILASSESERDPSRASIPRVYVLTDISRVESHIASRFLLGLTHMLTSPIHTIRLATSQLSVGARPERAARYHALIRYESDLFESRVNNLSAVTAVETRDARPRPTSFNLSKELRRHAEAFVFAAGRKGLLFTAALPPRDVKVHLDLGMTLLIVDNLVENALKYTRRGRVTLQVVLFSSTPEGPPEALRIVVEDTGPGILAPDKERIWDKFARGSDEFVRKADGFGLGCYLVRRCAEVQGGRATLDGSYQGGARFIVDLPVDCGDRNIKTKEIPR